MQSHDMDAEAALEEVTAWVIAQASRQLGIDVHRLSRRGLLALLRLLASEVLP